MISCGDIFCFRYFNNQNQSVMIPLVKENDSWTLRENRSTYSDEDDTYLLYCAQDLRQIIYCQGSDIILANFLRTVFGYPEWEKVVIGNSDGKIIASMVTADNTQLMFLSAREYGCCSLQTYDIRNKCRDSYEMVNTALLYTDSAVIAPDGMSIAINSYFSTDNYITEIYRETGSEWICSFICPADANLPFFLGNDGYAVESYDHIVRFNEDTYRESQTARGLCFSHEEECSRLQVSPDGSAVVFGRGHEIAFVYLWDGEKWNRSALNDLDPFFISAADDGVLVRRNWDEDSAVYYPDGRIETIPFTPVAHTSNLSHMVTYSDDGLIIMKRNGDSWSEKCRITIGKDYKKGKFDCPGSEFFARYDGKTVYVYDWNGNIIDEIPCKAAKPSAYALSMSKDAHLIAVVQYNAENSGLHILEKGEDGWSDTFIRHGSDTDDEDKEFSVDKLNAQVCVTTSGQVVICDNSPLTFSKIDGQWKVTEIWNLAGTSLRTRQFAVSRDGDVYAGTDNRPDKARVVIGRK